MDIHVLASKLHINSMPYSAYERPQIRFHGRYGVGAFMLREPSCNNLTTSSPRFGGLGFELMRDGDVNGLWGLMEHGIR